MIRTAMRAACALLLGVGLMAATATPAHAERRCEREVRKAEEHYRDAVRRHGEHSKQAEHARREVENARARCR